MKAIRFPNETPVNSSVNSGADTTGISPSKRASLRTQYIIQLQQLHSLYEAGAITKREYEEQKGDTLVKLCEL